MSTLRAEPGWADVLLDCAADQSTADRLIRQLAAAQVASLAFCRLLERWGRGDAAPSTAGARQAALRRAADRAETALSVAPANVIPAGAFGSGTVILVHAVPSQCSTSALLSPLWPTAQALLPPRFATPNSADREPPGWAGVGTNVQLEPS